MKIEVEIEERDDEDELDEELDYEFVSCLNFQDCSRKDLEELGKFFLLASKSLRAKRIGPNEIQVSYMRLNSKHFEGHETDIIVSLHIDEP